MRPNDTYAYVVWGDENPMVRSFIIVGDTDSDINTAVGVSSIVVRAVE